MRISAPRAGSSSARGGDEVGFFRPRDSIRAWGENRLRSFPRFVRTRSGDPCDSDRRAENSPCTCAAQVSVSRPLLTSAQRQVRTGMEFEQFVQFVQLSSESPIRVATDDDCSQFRDLLLGHGSGIETFVSASILISLAGPTRGKPVTTNAGLLAYLPILPENSQIGAEAMTQLRSEFMQLCLDIVLRFVHTTTYISLRPPSGT